MIYMILYELIFIIYTTDGESIHPKYPIPDQLPLILKNISRELLRDQPPKIIQYATHYFQALEKGQEFKYNSKYNVHKSDKQYELQYAPAKAQDIVKKNLEINKGKNQQKIQTIVKFIFQNYDKDSSGQLESVEVSDVLHELARTYNIHINSEDGRVREFIALVDKNNDKKIRRVNSQLFQEKCWYDRIEMYFNIFDIIRSTKLTAITMLY